jgi:hypothetical protein
MRALSFLVTGALLSTFVAAACSFSPALEEGAIACADAGRACPPGFTCGADLRCYSHPRACDGDCDAATSDGASSSEAASTCNATSCPDGCCSGATCLRGNEPSACGAGGGACKTCPAGDTCDAGACSGCKLRCTTGCCAGDACSTPSFASCGAVGAACVACDPSRADACSPDGRCTCGTGPACAAGQRCASGICTCDATSCPSGCCAADQCKLPSVETCGMNGGPCLACNSRAADRCNGGICACGSAPACALVLTCQDGACQ